jgi:hypothetical protein
MFLISFIDLKLVENPSLDAYEIDNGDEQPTRSATIFNFKLKLKLEVSNQFSPVFSDSNVTAP